MPSHEKHCQQSYERYNKRFDKLHTWMDEPWKLLGKEHRMYRHDPYISPKEVKELFGKYADHACLDHILLDNHQGKWGIDQWVEINQQILSCKVSKNRLECLVKLQGKYPNDGMVVYARGEVHEENCKEKLLSNLVNIGNNTPKQKVFTAELINLLKLAVICYQKAEEKFPKEKWKNIAKNAIEKNSDRITLFKRELKKELDYKKSRKAVYSVTQHQNEKTCIFCNQEKEDDEFLRVSDKLNKIYSFQSGDRDKHIVTGKSIDKIGAFWRKRSDWRIQGIIDQINRKEVEVFHREMQIKRNGQHMYHLFWVCETCFKEINKKAGDLAKKMGNDVEYFS